MPFSTRLMPSCNLAALLKDLIQTALAQSLNNVATDGNRRDLYSVPRDNPADVAVEFARQHPVFFLEQPPWLVNKSELSASITPHLLKTPLAAMASEPLISICIPVYNQRPEFLRACIASALAQTYVPLEVVVSDNHSTNDPHAVFAEFHDARLRVVQPPQHVGMSENFAFAAEAAHGEIISFLSSDDLLLPQCCATLAPLLRAHSTVAFVYGAIQQVDEAGNIFATQRKSHPTFVWAGRDEFQRYVRRGGTWLIGALIRRSSYRAAGGFGAGFDEVSDWYLALRLLTQGDVAYYDEPVAWVRIWLTPERRQRLAGAVRSIRQLYEWLETPALLAQVDGGQTTLQRARRQWANDFAASLPDRSLPPNERAATITEIQLLDHSSSVRVRLWLGRTPLAFLLIVWARITNRLRQWAVRLVYLARKRIRQ